MAASARADVAMTFCPAAKPCPPSAVRSSSPPMNWLSPPASSICASRPARKRICSPLVTGRVGSSWRTFSALEVVGQRLEPARAVLACRVVDDDRWCRRCGCEGTPRGTVVRRLAHEPFGWRPTVLLVRVRRYRCGECGLVWRQDTSKAAEPRAKLSRRALRWALEGLVVAHLTAARTAEALAVSWNTANDAVLAEGQRALIDDPQRFDGVQVVGVDEHVVRHEALLFRMEVRDHHCLVVVAAG